MVGKDSYYKLKTNKNLKFLFLVLFGIVGVGLLLIFRYYFWPFLMALILYLALKPGYDRIQARVKIRGLSSLLVIILLILLILVPFVYLLSSLTDQAYQMYSYIERHADEKYFERIGNMPVFELISHYLNITKDEIFTRLNSYAQRTAGRVLAGISDIISYPISLMINFFFMLLILFFLLKDGYRLSTVFYRVLPFPYDIEKQVVERLKEVIKILLAGNLLIMVLQGTMLGVGFYIAGIRAPLLWGSIAAVLSLIPVVGTTFIWIPCAIFLIFEGSYLTAFFVGSWCLVWYLLLENLVKPKVFGEKLHFHPVVLFFLLLGSLNALNLPGVIIGPLLLTLFYSFWEIYKILEGIDTETHGENE